MNTSAFPPRRSIAASLLAVAIASFFLPAGARAFLPPLVTNGTFTLGGHTGTYTRKLYNQGGIYRLVVVYTRNRDGAIRTDETVITAGPLASGSHGVDYYHTDFGESAQSVFHKDVSETKHGLASATGTYTTANGDSGTLAILESQVDGVLTISETRTSATTGVTQILRTEQDAPDLVTVMTITQRPGGEVHRSQLVRSGAGDEGDGLH